MALSRHHATLTRPRSVQEIVEEAQSFEFNPIRTVTQWLRSGRMLLTEASIYEDQGNLQMTYLYMYRHAELILARLPTHPDYKDPRYKDELTQAKKEVKKNLVKLELWKPRINQEYQRYVKAMERRNTERKRLSEEYNNAQKEQYPVDAAAQYGAQNINTYENRQLAVSMALQEIQRRGTSKSIPNQAVNSAPTAQSRLAKSHLDNAADSERQLSDGIREAARHLQLHSAPTQHPKATASGTTASSHAYPAVPTREPVMEWHGKSPPPELQSWVASPAIPSKVPLRNSAVPELSATASSSHAPPPPLPSKQLVSPPPVPSKISHHTFESGAQNPSSLRPLLIPSSLTTTFTKIAAPNTLRNLETCGILAGTLLSSSSTLALTHLILPAQHSTPDTCDTTADGDVALFTFCDQHRLLVLGWIHTHPTQTCFLSSRDLHTSAAYQTMLPEAIAIVCAPRQRPDVGVFRLTDPPGLTTVLECRREGVFHPHPDVDGGLYTDAEGGTPGTGGHAVVVAEGMDLEVVDLRE